MDRFVIRTPRPAGSSPRASGFAGSVTPPRPRGRKPAPSPSSPAAVAAASHHRSTQWKYGRLVQLETQAEQDHQIEGALLPPRDAGVRVLSHPGSAYGYYAENRRGESGWRPVQIEMPGPFDCIGTVFEHSGRRPSWGVIPPGAARKRRHGGEGNERAFVLHGEGSSSAGWVKCVECHRRDRAFATWANAKAAATIAGNDKLFWAGSSKRKRELKKQQVAEELRGIASATPAAAASGNGAGPAPSPKRARLVPEEFGATVTLLSGLKLPEIREALVRNDMMATGPNKSTLVLRLAQVKHHGSPGKCPQCNQKKLELLFDGASGSLQRPVRVVCKHMRGQGVRCGYTKKLKGSEYDRAVGHSWPFRHTPATKALFTPQAAATAAAPVAVSNG